MPGSGNAPLEMVAWWHGASQIQFQQRSVKKQIRFPALGPLCCFSQSMFVPSVRGREGEGVDGRLSVRIVRLSEFWEMSSGREVSGGKWRRKMEG